MNTAPISPQTIAELVDPEAVCPHCGSLSFFSGDACEDCFHVWDEIWAS